jgi:glucose repression mediator protein
MQCYEQALKFNQWSVPAMQGIACILRTKDLFPAAVEYLRTIIKVDSTNGDVWGSLGEHFLRSLQGATNIQRSLLSDDGRLAGGVLCLPTSALPPGRPKGKLACTFLFLDRVNIGQEPKLWYGIGILYDRYGSLEHAEEAFSQVMRMEPNFEKANEIYFRLGIIYKQQQKFNQSLDVSAHALNSDTETDRMSVLQVHCS